MYRSTGDNHWLGVVLQRYTALLLGVAMKYLKDRNAAEDAVQAVFLRALTHFPTEPVQNIKGWLYILVRNQCLQTLRDKSIELLSDTLPDQTPAEEHDNTSFNALDDEQIWHAVAQLNEEQRLSVEMFYLKKMSYDEIMVQTGFTFMQVKSYIQNGKRNLKTIILKHINTFHGR